MDTKKRKNNQKKIYKNHLNKTIKTRKKKQKH